jgi:serine protease Do
MNSRTRTLASFFSIAMAAMLLGAFVTTQIRPEAARASAEPMVAGGAGAPSRATGAFGLDTFRDIARSRTSGVVNINTKKETKRPRRDPFHDFFGDDMMERFFGPQRGDKETQRSLGSGFIIDKDGYVLTNRHVVEGADEISVTLSTQRLGDRPYAAKLVGRDARTDVALLKIESKEPLTVLPLGNSDETEVGEWVMAIGNPFGLGGNSVTVGVVSFKGRNMQLGVQGTWVDMIQTDASINPGNSGGPLLNSKGEVVGINTLIVTGGMSQSAGVGFAVPINVAKAILPQLRDKGKVVRGWLGVQIESLRADVARSYKLKDSKGAVISDVTADSPAEKAGLKPEDVVIAVDGHPVENNNDLSSYVAARAPGTTVSLKLLRGGAEKTVTVTLGTYPDSETAEATKEEDSATLGLTLRDLSPDMAGLPRTARGVVVVSVEAGSAGEDAGLQRGDLIVAVGGEVAETVRDFEKAVAKAKVDGVARIRFRRGGSHFVTALRLD